MRACSARRPLRPAGARTILNCGLWKIAGDHRTAEVVRLIAECGMKVVLFPGNTWPWIQKNAPGDFAGLRTAEIQRLHWEDVLCEQGWLEIKPGKAKTGSRRLRPIPENLRRWLEPVRRMGPVMPEKEIWRDVTALSAPLGCAWERKLLRHPAISCRVAATQNVNQVAIESWNSAAILFKHHRELVTPADAEKWRAIRPKPGSGAGSVHQRGSDKKRARGVHEKNLLTS